MNGLKTIYVLSLVTLRLHTCIALVKTPLLRTPSYPYLISYLSKNDFSSASTKSTALLILFNMACIGMVGSHGSLADVVEIVTYLPRSFRAGNLWIS